MPAPKQDITVTVDTAAQARPGADPRRKEAAPWLKSSSATVLDVWGSFLQAMDRAETTAEAQKYALELAGQLDKLGKDPTYVAPIGKGYVERTVEVPGEGQFIVRENSLQKVELTALMGIGGTGIGVGEHFAVDADYAVRLVVNGGAAPRQAGGIRRSKGIPSGEPSASAA